MRFTAGTRFLAFAAFLDFIEISSGMEPEPRDSLKNGGTSSKHANRQDHPSKRISSFTSPQTRKSLVNVGTSGVNESRQEISSLVSPKRRKYPENVETSIKHANRQETSSGIAPKKGKYLQIFGTSSQHAKNKVAARWLELEKNTILVEMFDHSIFNGRMEPYPHGYIPGWMYSDEITASSFFALIILENCAYGGILLPEEKLPFDHDPAPYGLHRAQIRIDDKNFFKASEFRPYARRPSRERPPNNCIYIKNGSGGIEIASLRPKNLRHASSR